MLRKVRASARSRFVIRSAKAPIDGRRAGSTIPMLVLGDLVLPITGVMSISIFSADALRRLANHVRLNSHKTAAEGYFGRAKPAPLASGAVGWESRRGDMGR